MQYKLSRRYGRGPDTPVAEFVDVSDAKLFVEKKLELDAAMKINVMYRLYDFTELLEEYDTSKATTSSSQSQSGGQDKGASARFSPTPFNMTPRPSGMPPKWIKDNEDEDKKK